jgi:hypothetical protein
VKSRALSLPELGGFVAIVAAVVALMLVLDLDGGSWGAFALFAAGLATLLAYRAFLRRRRSV